MSSLLQSATARLQPVLHLDRREARLEAQILAAHALGVDRAWLIGHDRDALSPDQSNAIEKLISRREQGEPVAYILGEKEFYGRVFKVTPDVLIPRPETELLVETALERLPRHRPARILDLGTGSGCIAITLALECQACEVWAVDRSKPALALAADNAGALGANVRFLESDWFEALGACTFDLIVANPPYVRDAARELAVGDVRYEPLAALAAGETGLDDVRLITAGAPHHLAQGGWLLIEHGWDQGGACRNLFLAHGFSAVETLRDFSGHERITSGRQPG